MVTESLIAFLKFWSLILTTLWVINDFIDRYGHMLDKRLDVLRKEKQAMDDLQREKFTTNNLAKILKENNIITKD